MKRLSRTAVFGILMVLGTLSSAQIPGGRIRPVGPPSDPTDLPAHANDAPLTLTGCLVKGLSANEYEIADRRSGEKYSFGAPDHLQRFFNQTVQLTGTVELKGLEKSFRPESVKPLAPGCERAQ